MNEIFNMRERSKTSVYETANFGMMEITNEVLLDAQTDITDRQVISMPIAELAILGAGVSSLMPFFRTFTQTTTVSAEGLYRLANADVGDVLKIAKNGNFWGAFKTSQGTSKFAQLQAAATTPATVTTHMPINPACIMMAVALFSIEQKLGDILETEKQILSFLMVEKEAEIEADVETLSSIITKYKHSWDNEHFITSNHKMVLDIQRTARKHMNSYQKKLVEILSIKKLVVSQSQVNMMLKDLLKKFKYYRLSLYAFSMASFVEVILSGDFKEENICLVKNEIEDMSAKYREIFGQCSVFLEKFSQSSLDTTFLKGFGSASKAVGKFIEGIPVVREGQVDEFLQNAGSQIGKNVSRIERSAIETFSELRNPCVNVFVEKMNDMIRIYGHTEEICFDDKQIYLVVG